MVSRLCNVCLLIINECNISSFKQNSVFFPVTKNLGEFDSDGSLGLGLGKARGQTKFRLN